MINSSSAVCRRVAGALECQEKEAERERGGSSSREQESNSRTWSNCQAESLCLGSQTAPVEEAELEDSE